MREILLHFKLVSNESFKIVFKKRPNNPKMGYKANSLGSYILDFHNLIKIKLLKFKLKQTNNNYKPIKKDSH
jgi:hypothetical protein